MSAGLLIALLACHFAADFTHLSRPFMLKAKATGFPVLPILAHGAVHGILIGAVCWLLIGPAAGAFAFAVQLVSHTAIDVLKGRVNVWLPMVKDPTKYPHWILFGADQFAHQTVIILTILFAT